MSALTDRLQAAEQNPWYQEAFQREGEFGDRRYFDAEAALIRAEYLFAPEPFDCPKEDCDSQIFWRATIGAMKCPDCGCLASSNGTVIR